MGTFSVRTAHTSGSKSFVGIVKTSRVDPAFHTTRICDVIAPVGSERRIGGGRVEVGSAADVVDDRDVLQDVLEGVGAVLLPPLPFSRQHGDKISLAHHPVNGYLHRVGSSSNRSGSSNHEVFHHNGANFANQTKSVAQEIHVATSLFTNKRHRGALGPPINDFHEGRQGDEKWSIKE